jgi:hypothetical protein
VFPTRLANGLDPVESIHNFDPRSARNATNCACVTPGSTVTYASFSSKSNIRVIRLKSRIAVSVLVGTEDPYPQFFPLLTGYTPTRYRVAIRRQSCTSARVPGRKIAGIVCAVANVVVAAAANAGRSVTTNSDPRHSRHSKRADAHSALTICSTPRRNSPGRANKAQPG